MNKLPKFIRRYNTRFFFKFTISHPALTDAECFGRTENEFTQTKFDGQISNINRKIEKGALRFPRSKRFNTEQEASFECDVWRHTLHTRFGVHIERWSSGSLEDFLFRLNPNVELPDSLELQDFIDRNRDALETHRASQDTSEKQLHWIAQHGEPAKRQTAETLIAKQTELLEFCQRVDIGTVRKKSESLAHYTELCVSPLDSLFKATSGVEGNALRDAILKLREIRLTVLGECETILARHDKLTETINQLKAKL